MRRKITYDPARDYYTILEIDTRATPEEVRQAYRRSVRRVHPDANPDRTDWATEQIQSVNEAYDVLNNAARRKQYDRLRWPYLPAESVREGVYRSPFDEPGYDSSRPWWDQMAERSPRGYPFGAGPPDRRGEGGNAQDLRPPPWMAVANWMNDHRLSALEPAWLMVIGLWRSPYGGVLSILSLALGINVAAIIYVASSPQRWVGVEEWFDSRDGVAAVAQSSPSPDRLNLTCSDPAVQIKTPSWGDVVGDSFSIYGTVHHAELWHYQIDVGYAGDTASAATAPSAWTTIRPPPHNQSIPEPPIKDGLLTDEPVDLTGQPAGLYAIRLRVTLRSGKDLAPCDVVVRHS